MAAPSRLSYALVSECIGQPEDLWLYRIAPLAGGVAAALLFRALPQK